MFPPHSAISVRVLEEKGYRSDAAAGRRFEAPYRWFVLPGVVLFCGSVPLTQLVLLTRYPGHPWTAVGIAAMLLGFALAGVPTLRALHAVPENRRTGNRLDVYERADALRGHGHLSYVYVDHDDRTYFVRVVGLGYRKSYWQLRARKNRR